MPPDSNSIHQFTTTSDIRNYVIVPPLGQKGMEFKIVKEVYPVFFLNLTY